MTIFSPSVRAYLKKIYFSLIGNIFVILSIFFSTDCTAWNIVQELFHALVGLMIATFLTLRIYALYGSIVTDLLASSTPMLSSIPSAGCHDILALKEIYVGLGGDVDVVSVVAVGWEALLVYDILLFGMTLAKAYQARYQLGTQHLRGMSLISVIIRDVNFVNVFTFYVRSSVQHFLLSVTIMSRLMLHLHEIGTQGLYADHAKTMRGPVDSGQEYGMTFTTLWSDSDPSTTGSSGMGGLSAFEQGSSSGYQSPS
ncbi:hypothetical protein F5890DRAFT_1526249 [Lentinula detonsa]|uniref:Uncharacterized protein n=1 Tax=Lentinula detonsa TaxID=2804962 RepID=A0AA38PWH1_9AGAR|nr:hypothetical protein F5890DRAFT_1526249 [Lentinula detonsa]